MITFFIVAGFMLAIALAFVVPPLIGKRLRSGEVSHGQTNLSIYRDQLRELDSDLANGTLDQAQYEAAKREIERRALDEYEDDQQALAAGGGPKWTLATVIAVLIPLVTISVYLALGSPVALDKANVAAQAPEGGGHELTPERLSKMVENVYERLKANPDDVDGWMMLAKTTQALGRYPESVKAYRELIKRLPPDAQLLADFADTLAMANGRTLEGEPAQVIERALKIDPNNVKALALSGTIAFKQGKYEQAAAHWRRILDVVPPEAEFSQRIRESIADAEQRAGKPLAAADAAPKNNAATAGAGVRGKLVLDSAVAKAVTPGDTVFIFARPASGPKMPLAVKRITVKELPAEFELTESMAVAPGMSLSKFPDVVVGARVSKSGSATPQPGDWESETVPAKVGGAPVSLVISRIVR